MSKIQKLSDHVINQISAGEVVERPLSVVKELVDNSLDAGASRIDVVLIEGGRDLIRVVDNGSGIEPEDLQIAVERHATSKISAVDDLWEISSMGFRGEALSSIASVSDFSLVSRTKDSAVAHEICVKSGVASAPKQCKGAIGSKVEVARLFHNVPVRRKFLRQPKTEAARVKAWINAIAIAYPDVHFTLKVEDREVINLAPRKTTLLRGAELFKELNAVKFDWKIGVVGVQGLLAHPEMAQKKNQALTILVNKRVVFDRTILRATKDGFQSTLKAQEIPYGFVMINLPASEVDVNVHPQKSEVRFKDSQSLYVAVRDIVKRAVDGFKAPLSVVSGSKEKVALNDRVSNAGPSYSEVSFGSRKGVNQSFALGNVSSRSKMGLVTSTFDSKQRSPEPASTPFGSIPKFEFKEEGESPFDFKYRDLHVVGQVLGCYIVCELADELYVIDMHAAHERCNYNRILRDFAAGGLASQNLLVPHSIKLDEEALIVLSESRGILSKLGINFEVIGDTAIELRSLPTMLTLSSATDLVKELAALESDEERQGIAKDYFAYVIARRACHKSVRSGDRLEALEISALLDELDQTDFSAACPHGRPVIVKFKRAQVERWFGRDH